MNYYAMQVKTGDEELVRRRIEIYVHSGGYNFFCPRRKLRERRRGKIQDIEKPVFAGYLFLASEDDPAPIYLVLKGTEGFYRFVPASNPLSPLAGKDLDILKHFMSFGKVSDISKVSFDANERIVVHSGPLKGYEGYVVKVDKRKGRARLRLDFCSGPMTIDLSFAMIEKAGKGAETEDGRDAEVEDLHNRGGLRGEDPSPGD
jgi:transcriptional antiterminator NusG